MNLPTETVLDSPGGEVEDAADSETLKWPMEASMGQTSLVMAHASTNVPTFLQTE